jgi:hypothetical protein
VTDLPAGLDTGFRAAAGELGMATAAWLYVREVASVRGAEGVQSLRDALGRAYPVLDVVAASWLEGRHAPDVDLERALPAFAGVRRIVVASIESAFLDALVPALPQVSFALLRHRPFPVDWDRLKANYAGRLELVGLDDFQRWAGPRSALLTFAYGVTEHHAHVSPIWLRAAGPDVRTQFRALIAWDVTRAPMSVYPRWLVQVPLTDFTGVIS